MAKKPQSLDINITGSSGNYTATVSNAHCRAKPGKDLTWVVHEPAGFPADAVVFLQFYEVIGDQKVYSSGCLVDGAKNNGKQPGHKGGANDHRVNGRVGASAHGSFLYEIRYSDPSGDYMLLDPEIIVEGNPPLDGRPPKRKRKGGKKRGKAAKKAKKKAGKKAGKKKAAKKGKAKKAKKKTAKRRATKKR